MGLRKTRAQKQLSQLPKTHVMPKYISAVHCAVPFHQNLSPHAVPNIKSFKFLEANCCKTHTHTHEGPQPQAPQLKGFHALHQPSLLRSGRAEAAVNTGSTSSSTAKGEGGEGISAWLATCSVDPIQLGNWLLSYMSNKNTRNKKRYDMA